MKTIAFTTAILAATCFLASAKESTMNITRKPFGKTTDGTEVELFTLTNDSGMSVSITNYGGIVTSIIVPDRDGKPGDVACGYDKVEDYIAGSPYFGAITGRYANRIAGGKFSLDGKEYELATNNAPNHLHGGKIGFDKRVWSPTPKKGGDSVSLELRYKSPDGEEGYPGELSCTVIYSLPKGENALHISYHATTTKATPINLTNHSYFNLAGHGAGEHLDHEIMINADRFTPTDETAIPTGELRAVKGTPLDFTTPHKIGERIGANDEQIKFGKGYDHNWVINQKKPGELTLAARVYEPTSGRVLETFTTEPGVQFYTGNFLDGTNIGKGGKVYKHRYAFCLETQHFPDSPNQKSFPSTILKPGEKYSHTCIYKFSTKK
jgi:aldose 1-epimerase